MRNTQYLCFDVLGGQGRCKPSIQLRCGKQKVADEKKNEDVERELSSELPL